MSNYIHSQNNTPPNPYYQPEAFGLTPIGELNVGGEWEFDILSVYINSEGRLVWISDSGCSCPTPFDYVTISDLQPGTLEECLRAIDAHIGYNDREWSRVDRLHLKERVREAVREYRKNGDQL